jgi:predicted nucleotidyltransferase
VINLTPSQHAAVAAILLRIVPQASVFIFGSRACGKVKEHSDLDIAIKGDTCLEKEVLRTLKTTFEESELPFKVDIVDMNALSDSFKKIVEKDAKEFRFKP